MPDIFLVRRGETRDGTGGTELTEESAEKVARAGKYLRYALLGAPLVVFASKQIADRVTAHKLQRAMRPDDPVHRVVALDERLDETEVIDPHDTTRLQQFGQRVSEVLRRTGRAVERESYTRRHEFDRPGIAGFPSGVIVAGETAIRSLVVHLQSLRGQVRPSDVEQPIAPASVTRVGTLDEHAWVNYVGHDS